MSFNRTNFNKFIYFLQKESKQNGEHYSTHYINNFLKLAKHLDLFLGTNELKIYKHFVSDKDTVLPGDTLTPSKIKKLAHVRMKYSRMSKLKNQKMEALILFLGIVGSRIGETLQLQREWIQNNGHPTVYFPKQITKTKKERWCVIPKHLYKLLIALPENPDGTLFGLYDTSGINEDLKMRAEKCGIQKRVFCHLFRYSSINNKLEAGIPLEIVTAYHGHSTTTITYKYYARLQMQKAADIFYLYDPFFMSELDFEVISDRSFKSVEKLLEKKEYKKKTEYDPIGKLKLTKITYVEGGKTFIMTTSEPA